MDPEDLTRDEKLVLLFVGACDRPVPSKLHLNAGVFMLKKCLEPDPESDPAATL